MELSRLRDSVIRGGLATGTTAPGLRDRAKKGARSLHPGYTYGRQLILWTGAPERQLIASPEMTKPCFS